MILFSHKSISRKWAKKVSLRSQIDHDFGAALFQTEQEKKGRGSTVHTLAICWSSADFDKAGTNSVERGLDLRFSPRISL